MPSTKIDAKQLIFNNFIQQIRLWKNRRNQITGDQAGAADYKVIYSPYFVAPINEDKYELASEYLKPEFIFDNLTATADNYLVQDPKILLQTDPEFLAEYLYTNPNKINKFLQDDADNLSLNLTLYFISALLQESNVYLLQSINIITKVLAIEGLSAAAKFSISKLWLFALLEKMNRYNSIQKSPFARKDLSAILYITRTLKDYIKFIGNPDVTDADGNTILHFIATLNFEHQEIVELLNFLADNDFAFQKPNNIAVTPMQRALEVYNHNSIAKTLAYHLDIEELEKCLYFEANKETVNQNNIIFLILQLAKKEGWDNFALVIQNESLWKKDFFVDLNLVHAIGEILYKYPTSLAESLNCIRTKQSYATLQIAACIVAKNSFPQHTGNVMQYLADNPLISEELISSNHLSILQTIFKRPNFNYSAKTNIRQLFFSEDKQPIQTAINRKNFAVLVLVLLFSYDVLSNAQKYSLRDAMLPLIKIGVKPEILIVLKEHLINEGSCIDSCVASVRRDILQAINNKERLLQKKASPKLLLTL